MHTGLTLTKPYTRPLRFGDRTVHPPAPPDAAPLHIGDLNNLERFPQLTALMTELHTQLRDAGSQSARKPVLKAWVKAHNQRKAWVELPLLVQSISYRQRPQTEVGLGDLALYALIEQHHVKRKELFYSNLAYQKGDPNYRMLHLVAGVSHPGLQADLLTQVNRPVNQMDLIDEGAHWLLTVDEYDQFLEALSQHPDKLTRAYAASQIQQIADPIRRMRVTQAMMEDPAIEVLTQVIEKGELTNAKKDDYLEALCKTEIPERRAVGAKYVTRITQPTRRIKALQLLMVDPDPRVLIEAIPHIAAIESSKKRARLLRHHAKNPSQLVQKAVLNELSTIISPVSRARIFLVLVKSRYSAIREELAKNPDLLAAEKPWHTYYYYLWREKNPTVLVNLGKHLNSVAFPEVRTTLIQFLSNHAQVEVQDSVTPHLGSVDPLDILPAWERALTHPNTQQRAKAKRVIEQVKSPIIRFYLEYLANQKPETGTETPNCFTRLRQAMQTWKRPKPDRTPKTPS